MEITEIIEQVDILSYIEQYCDLELRSNGEYWGLSPFKEEKTPSFSVNTDIQRFYDFSTGYGGNIVKFVQRYHNCSFPKAMEIIMKFANIKEDTSIMNQRLSCVNVAKRFRRRELNTAVSETQILPSDYMDNYSFNENKLSVWTNEGISLDVMRKFGVRYDNFSNRIVYPIKDYEGNIINISGRTLEEDYKEKKIRKYTYFKKFGSEMNTIYGFSDNKQAILDRKEIILFEGAKSVMLAACWGINNTGAVLTSHVSSSQFLFLIKLGVDVVIAFDKEINVLDDKQVQRLKRYVNVFYIQDRDDLLSEKMSPVDKGEDVFMKLYSTRRRLV